MTTRRPTIYFILNVLLLSSCTLIAPEPPQRTVRVKALADPSLRDRNSRWRDELRGLIEAASDYYEREFHVRFVTQSTAPYPEHRTPSTLDLLRRLQTDFPNDPADLIVAFTAEPTSRYLRAGRPRVDRIGNCQQGLARYVVVPVSRTFRYTGDRAEPEYDVIVLIHELAHVFGAEHLEDPRSIMHENFDYRSDIDMKNRRVILNNRSCPFARSSALG